VDGSSVPADKLGCMRDVVVYDDGSGVLGPLRDLRAAFDVRTGALTNLERLRAAGGIRVVGLVVPERLAAVTEERHGLPVNLPGLLGRGVWLADGLSTLLAGEGLAGGGPLRDEVTKRTVYAPAEGRTVESLLGGAGPAAALEAQDIRAGVLQRPWDVKKFRDACLGLDVARLREGAGTSAPVPPGVHVLGGHGVHIAAGVRVDPAVVLDASGGPIVLQTGAVVRPGAVVVGPCAVGANSVVLERAVVRASALGPWCKVGGEVSGCVFQGYANKAHDGFLGDSWVGEWVNLGAGTTGSNLLNTYGDVAARAMPGTSMERTGEQFLGAVLGDHVRTAIGTRLMTGAVVGTGTMWAATGPITGAVPRFTWATDAGLSRYRGPKFLEVAAAAMGRRGVVLGGAYAAAVRALLAAEAGTKES